MLVWRFFYLKIFLFLFPLKIRKGEKNEVLWDTNHWSSLFKLQQGLTWLSGLQQGDTCSSSENLETQVMPEKYKKCKIRKIKKQKQEPREFFLKKVPLAAFQIRSWLFFSVHESREYPKRWLHLLLCLNSIKINSPASTFQSYGLAVFQCLKIILAAVISPTKQERQLTCLRASHKNFKLVR